MRLPSIILGDVARAPVTPSPVVVKLIMKTRKRMRAKPQRVKA